MATKQEDREAQGRTAPGPALADWVAESGGGEILGWTKAAGGNRRQSWIARLRAGDGTEREVFLRFDPREAREDGAEPYDIEREAAIYRAVDPIPILKPRYIAENRALQALLTSHHPGDAAYRHLRDKPQKQAIAREFMEQLAMLHAYPAEGIDLPGSPRTDDIAETITAELDLWEAMYREVEPADPLLEFAFAWLRANIPQRDRPPCVVHGDAGPSNFLFHEGRLTALIDWEFTHMGDPMDDLAWFSMRCVMEPVPDFADAIRTYERAAGAPIDRQSVLYHRALVSARVVTIRHRQFAGHPALAIVSRGMNRRLLVDALAEAAGIALPETAAIAAPETPRTAVYDRLIDDLAEIVVPHSSDAQVIRTAKSTAITLKYLKAVDRYDAAMEAAERAALRDLLGAEVASAAAGRAMLTARLREGSVPFASALAYFAGAGAREAQLAAESSGGIAHRRYPPLPALPPAS